MLVWNGNRGIMLEASCTNQAVCKYTHGKMLGTRDNGMQHGTNVVIDSITRSVAAGLSRYNFIDLLYHWVCNVGGKDGHSNSICIHRPQL